jgi:hypothetical protein
MTWNVENLFDVGDVDGPSTNSELDDKIDSLRAVIDAEAPHVLALQEIGSENALGQAAGRSFDADAPPASWDRRRARDPRRLHKPPSPQDSCPHPAVSSGAAARPGRR